MIVKKNAMKKLYVNIIMFLIEVPALLLTLVIFSIFCLGEFLIPDSWKLSDKETWAINIWLDDLGYKLWHKISD